MTPVLRSLSTPAPCLSQERLSDADVQHGLGPNKTSPNLDWANRTTWASGTGLLSFPKVKKEQREAACSF